MHICIYMYIYIYIYIRVCNDGNDGGQFGKDFVEIYPTDLELKVEHNDIHATFIDADISINKGKIIYKMLDKI